MTAEPNASDVCCKDELAAENSLLSEAYSLLVAGTILSVVNGISMIYVHRKTISKLLVTV